MKYLYKITCSVNPKMPVGTVLAIDSYEGFRWICEWFKDGNFEEQFRAKFLGKLEGRTKKARAIETKKILERIVE